MKFKSKSNAKKLVSLLLASNLVSRLAHEFLREDFIFLTVGRIGGACSDVTQNIIQVGYANMHGLVRVEI